MSLQYSYNNFSRNFLQSTYSPSYENYAVCPVGVVFLLSALLGSTGIRQNTARQVASTLNIETHPPLLRIRRAKSMYLFLKKNLTSEKTKISRTNESVVNVETGVFLRKQYHFKKHFQNVMKNELMCEVENLNFKDQMKSIKSINEWVNNKSNGLISEYFKDRSELPANTRIAVINVVTFKDVWQKQFDQAYTRPGKFHASKSEKIDVEFMSVYETVGYANFEKFGLRMISKGFKNSRFTFIAVLPTVKFELHKILRLLKGEHRLSIFVDRLKSQFVHILLPKFTAENSINLIEIMEKMGITDMFDSRRANLSGITTSEKLKVDYLSQTTVLKVDEKGVEATAATGMYSLGRSLMMYRTNVTFHVNEPFVCFIYDKVLRTPLFAALIKKPETVETTNVYNDEYYEDYNY
ncbi:unnamed protein product [Trichobilharzia szidati]|nr:unnamed protein product [Trichobilharzia szidati]